MSVNPARSVGPALFVGVAALSQLWVFIVAPRVGGAVAGIVTKTGITGAAQGRALRNRGRLRAATGPFLQPINGPDRP